MTLTAREYRWLNLPSRRSIFRPVIDVQPGRGLHCCEVFSKQDLGDSDQLATARPRQLGALIRSGFEKQ